MNFWSLWSKRASSPVAHLGVGRVGLAFLFVVLASIVGIAGDARPAGAQDYPQTQTAYFGDKPVNLTVSSQWSGVQIGTNVTLESASRAGGGGKIYARSRVVLFRATNGVLKTDAELMALPGAKRVVHVFNNGGQPPIVETDDILVSFRPGTTAVMAQQVALGVGATLGAPLGAQSPLSYHVIVNTNTTAITAANALRQKAEVQWAYPNFIWPQKTHLVPNDPLFVQQDHLLNTAQRAGGLAGADIKATQAWNFTIGSPQLIIAVLDTGTDIDHEDLAGRIVAPRDTVDDDGDPRPPAGEDHGTACSGLALASMNNNLGVAGVAPNCRLMPIRVITDFTTLADIDEAFMWAANNGADVLSNSWGPTNPVTPLPPSTQAAIDFAATNGRNGKGCVILFSSGNDGVSMDQNGYASYSRVISIGAANNRDRRTSYSNFGATLDLVAPGGEFTGLATTDRTGAPGYSTGNYDLNFVGTSAACPVAAGVAALILSRDPNLTNIQVQNILQSTADKVGGVVYDANGHNDDYGSGRVNAFAALQSIIIGPRFSVSGIVTLANLTTPVPGVIVTAPEFGAVTTTAADGTYTLSGLQAGATTVVPSGPNYTFTPPSRNVFIAGADVTGINFVAQLVPKVTLIDPPSNITINTPTYLMRATTANDAAVQRMDFERTGDPTDLNKQSLVTIPDADLNGPSLITDNLPVNATGNTASVVVRVNIRHPRVQDLIINLIAPDGKRYLVYPQSLPSFGTSLNIAVQVNVGSIPIAGTWKLEVSDAVDAPFDLIGSGTLVSWGLTIRPWVLIASTNRPEAVSGEWQAVWPISQTPPGTYDVRALAISAGGPQQDVHFNIVIPQPTIVLLNPQDNDTINAPIDLLAQATGVGVIQRVDFERRAIAPSFNKGSAAAPLNLFIPDLSTVTSELLVPSGGVAVGATLHLELQHEFIGDVKITLVAPDGTQIVVLDDPTLNDPNFVRDISLPQLLGKNFAGTYKLIMQDRSVPDTGKLITFGLTFELPWTLIGSDATPDVTGQYSLPFNPVSIAGGVYDFRAVAVTLRESIEDINTDITVISSTKPTYTISGTITKGGTGLAGVRVARSGGGLATVTAITDGSGNYTLPPAIDGIYTVTPSLIGHSFTPISRRVTLNGGDLANISFVGVAGFSISGKVTTSTGAPLANVTIKRSGTTTAPAPVSVTTDANGLYSFAGLPSANYTITPVLTNTQFTPLSQTVTLRTTSIENVNFSGVTGFSIKGRVTTLNGTPINNVMITRGGGTVAATTNVNGEYTLSAVPNGTYFVVAARDGFTFLPISRNVTVSNTDVLNVDFIANQGVRVTGRVTTTLNAPLGGVRVEGMGATGLTVAATDAAGFFTFNSVEAGSYVIKPIAKNYAFTPAFQNVNVQYAPVTTTTFRGLFDATTPVPKVSAPVSGRNYISLTQATGTATDVGSGLSRVTGRLYRGAHGTTPAAFWAGGNNWTPTYTAANEILAAGTTSWSINLPILTSGNYSFRAAATDKAGNTGVSPDIAFSFGGIGAVVRITAPLPGNYPSFIRPNLVYGTTTSSGVPVARNTVRLYREASTFAPAGYWAGGSTWTTTYSTRNEVLAEGLYSWRLALPTLVPTTYTVRVTATDTKGTPGYSPNVVFSVSNGG